MPTIRWAPPSVRLSVSLHILHDQHECESGRVGWTITVCYTPDEEALVALSAPLGMFKATSRAEKLTSECVNNRTYSSHIVSHAIQADGNGIQTNRQLSILGAAWVSHPCTRESSDSLWPQVTADSRRLSRRRRFLGRWRAAGRCGEWICELLEYLVK